MPTQQRVPGIQIRYLDITTKTTTDKQTIVDQLFNFIIRIE